MGCCPVRRRLRRGNLGRVFEQNKKRPQVTFRILALNLSSPWQKSRGSRCERRGSGCKARRSRRCRVIVEEALHRRRAHAAATQRAPGVCGRWAALLVVAYARASTPSRAWPATTDPWRATPCDFYHGLLADLSINLVGHFFLDRSGPVAIVTLLGMACQELAPPPNPSIGAGLATGAQTGWRGVSTDPISRIKGGEPTCAPPSLVSAVT